MSDKTKLEKVDELIETPYGSMTIESLSGVSGIDIGILKDRIEKNWPVARLCVRPEEADATNGSNGLYHFLNDPEIGISPDFLKTIDEQSVISDIAFKQIKLSEGIWEDPEGVGLMTLIKTIESGRI